MAKALKTILLLLAFGSIASAQTTAISPPELARLPVMGLGSEHYWQPLVAVFGQDDAPSDTMLTIGMPPGMVLADTDEAMDLVNMDVQTGAHAAAE